MERQLSRPELILIVEDEPDAARLLAFHLHRRGYDTVIAEDGRVALNVAIERKPDLAVLDGMLPVFHGFEVCRLLKSSPSTSHIPIIMLTALASNDDKLKGFGLGVEDYVTKPYEMSELLARINSLLARVQV